LSIETVGYTAGGHVKQYDAPNGRVLWDALNNTFIAHRAAANRTALITDITSIDPGTHERIQTGISHFMSTGASYVEAVRQSIGALEATVMRQTFLMSYMNAFLLLAIMNTGCIPLVIVKIRKRKADQQPTAKMTISDH
jgi:MFS transporter, DHA2 family, multidrug resistance protein